MLMLPHFYYLCTCTPTLTYFFLNHSKVKGLLHDIRSKAGNGLCKDIPYDREGHVPIIDNT